MCRFQQADYSLSTSLLQSRELTFKRTNLLLSLIALFRQRAICVCCEFIGQAELEFVVDFQPTLRIEHPSNPALIAVVELSAPPSELSKPH